jgi:sensor domain DACNV-containing protein
MYEHPYRLDAVFVQHLFERLHGVRSTSHNHIPSDPETTLVFLVSVDDLTALINVAFWASFKKEEGRSATIALQYAPPDKADRPFLLQHPLPYSDENLSRISPVLQGSHVECGVWKDDTDQLVIWGLNTNGFTTEDCRPLRIYSREPGKLKVSFGSLNIIVTGTRILLLDNDFLSANLPPALSEKTHVGWEIEQILTAMSAHGSGGTFMIVPDNDAWRVSIKEPIIYAASTPFDTVSVQREMLAFLADHPYGSQQEYEKFFRRRGPFALGDPAREEELNTIHDHFLAGQRHDVHDGLVRSLAFLGQLTAVDGAVIVNDEVKVLAFGAKIKPLHARKSPETLLVSEPATGSVPEEVSLSEFGGMRHQSAAQFVFDQRQGVAFVASQDGIMSMLTWDEGAGRVAAVRHIELTF